jgi:hypothetical protein
MAKSRWLLLLLLSTMACNAIDGFLEGVPPPPPPPTGQLLLAPLPPSVLISQGQTQSIDLRLTRVGDVPAAISVVLEGVPDGVTMTIGTPHVQDRVHTFPLVISVADGVVPGTYVVRVRGSADGVTPASATVSLSVTEKPDVTLTVTPTTVEVSRGGIAPLRVALMRVNFPNPVNLSLSSAPGSLALLESNPVTGSIADVHVYAPVTVPPGTYPVTLVGSALGLSDPGAPLTVTVSARRLQVIAPAEVTASIGASTSVAFILNRTGISGGIALTAEELPAGVSAIFTLTGDHTATMGLSVAAEVSPGSYPARIRADAAGEPTATAEYVLTIPTTAISVSLNPAQLTLAPGGSAVATVTIQRTNFSGLVHLQVEGLPDGVSAVADPASVGGHQAVLTITSQPTAQPGSYAATLRAVPEGLLPGATQTVPLGLTIAVPQPAATVVLNWSTCTPPTWLAARDGEGPWVPVTGNAGQFSFQLYAASAGVAYVEGITTRVWLVEREQVDAGPVAMCPLAMPTTTGMSGTAIHVGPFEPFSYHLGGGTGASDGANPAFTITGVPPGVHDLVVTGFSGQTLSYRILLRRDVNVVPSGSLGTVDIAHPSESFTPQPAALQISFVGVTPGGALTRATSYLTTGACTVNPLFDHPIIRGVPPSWQRPDDFHMQLIRWTTPTTHVTTREVFHAVGDRSMSFPPALTASVSPLSGSFQRLRLVIPQLPQVYNGPVVFTYRSTTGQTMVITVDAARVRAEGGIDMPDLSGVAGWLPAYGPSAGSAGIWHVSAEGNNGAGPLCTEGRRVVTAGRNGTY